MTGEEYTLEAENERLRAQIEELIREKADFEYGYNQYKKLYDAGCLTWRPVFQKQAERMHELEKELHWRRHQDDCTAETIAYLVEKLLECRNEIRDLTMVKGSGSPKTDAG